ncbi:hypothetical protein T12_5719 [Trichinella patagoniensis]|uniref:Uncharacterized protein n=1 Tax=Trichinella patagoniensis TaxID=990121 RepID=A0A0V0Z275_9BILA|nr:hypothetical protein T12_5719 [Trichinella patagoniensis]
MSLTTLQWIVSKKYEVRTDASHLKAFHTACRFLDVVCLSKSKNIDFRDIRYESVDRRQLFQSFCRSMFNSLWFKGSVDEWMEFAFFLHLMMHRAFDKAGIMPYPAFSLQFCC